MRFPGKKLMILGAGPFQVAAIRKAAELGCHVVTVDCIPGNIGHAYSHQSADCSTVDREGVLDLAQGIGIDGIMTMASDVAVPTVAFVAHRLGLPGPCPEMAACFTDKSRFREFQQRHGLSHPPFSAATSFAEIDWSAFEGCRELIVKPSDTSGSRGVCRVASSNRAGRERAFEAAREYSRTGTVCVEEFVEGTDVTGEGFLFADRDPAVVFTQKFTRECMVTGHRLPGVLSAHQERLALASILAACKAADYCEGPFDADLRVTDDEAVILEMSPRLGGNGCPLLLHAHTGNDVVQWTINLALGEDLPAPQFSPARQGFGSTIIGSDQAGSLAAIRTIDELRTLLPYVTDGVWAVQPGDRINKTRHGGDALGFVIFQSDSPDDFVERANRIRGAAGIEINSANVNACPS